MQLVYWENHTKRSKYILWAKCNFLILCHVIQSGYIFVVHTYSKAIAVQRAVTLKLSILSEHTLYNAFCVIQQAAWYCIYVRWRDLFILRSELDFGALFKKNLKTRL
jgi:hypothetical protein